MNNIWKEGFSRLAFDFLSPCVHVLLETLASLITIGLDVKYFFVYVKRWNKAFFVGICHLHCDSFGDGDVREAVIYVLAEFVR